MRTETRMKPKKILTVANQKGGVAKSTTCAQAAGYLAGQGYKVLLIDLDPQCNQSAKFLTMGTDFGSDNTYTPPKHPDDGVAHSSAALFKGESWNFYPTATPNLFILPAASHQFNEAQYPKDAQQNLMDWMNMPELWEAVDLVIFDTPPAKNLYSESAILAATHVLIPCPMEKSPFEGLMAVMQFVNLINDPLPPEEMAKVIGIMPSLFQSRSALHKSFLAKLKRNQLLGHLATPFEMRWRPTYQEVDMLAVKHPYEIRNNKRNEAAYQEWQQLGNYLIDKLSL